MFYVAFFPVHGLKCVYAKSVEHARTVFMKNNGGSPPSWLVRVPRVDLDAAMRLARLGWRGSVDKFNRDSLGV